MKEFTAQDWILIIGAIGLVLNNMISNWKMNAKVDTINATAKVIEGHVNSATTKADERAQAGVEREKRLQITIDYLKETAALLAQAQAMRESPGPSQQQEPPAATATKIPEGSIKALAAKLEIKPKGTTGE